MMHDKIMTMLFDEDEITWQSIIYELVKKEEMDPWDIDIKLLSQRFLDMVKTLQKLDFRISGKIILAAAILLRIKSNRLLEEDIGNLNRLIALSEEDLEEGMYSEIDGMGFDRDHVSIDEDKFKLIPRTPQPRKRKVSVYDLVEALQKALDVRKRRVKRFAAKDETDLRAPDKQKDITEVIKEIYGQITTYLIRKKAQKVMFSELIPSADRNEKIYAFAPLLHLDYQRKIELYQEKHLGDIQISLYSEHPAKPAAQ